MLSDKVPTTSVIAYVCLLMDRRWTSERGLRRSWGWAEQQPSLQLSDSGARTAPEGPNSETVKSHADYQDNVTLR